MRRLVLPLAIMVAWFGIVGSFAYSAYEDRRWFMLVFAGVMGAFGIVVFTKVFRSLESPEPAVESEIDAETPAEIAPPPSPGQRVVAVVMFCAASVALVLLVATVVAGLRSRNWPTVEGVIVESEYWETRSRGGGGFQVDVDYEYRPRRRNYETDNITVSGSGASSRADAREITARYRVGSKVRVHYHPDRPKLAVLEPGVPKSVFFIGLFVLLPSVVGTVFWFGTQTSSGRVRIDLSRAAANRPRVRYRRIDLTSAVLRMFPAFVVTFWGIAAALNAMNVRWLNGRPNASVGKGALIWGVCMLAMLALNRWWLPHISQRAMMYVGIACGAVSALIYTYLPWIPFDEWSPLQYYFRGILSWLLMFNLMPLLPAVVIAAQLSRPRDTATEFPALKSVEVNVR